jgi:hypothetical protein
LAYFASASADPTAELVDYLLDLLGNLDEDSEDVGTEPYNIPRKLIDPKCALSIELPGFH